MNEIIRGLLFAVCLAVVFGCGEVESAKQERIDSENPSIEHTKAEEERDILPSADREKNRSPRVTSIKIIRVSDGSPGEEFRAVAGAKDADGDGIIFRYQWKMNGEKIIGAVEEILELEERLKKGDKVSVEVIPYDGKAEGLWKSEAVFIVPNSAPRITSEPAGRIEGGKFSYVVKTEDPDGDPVEIALEDAPEGMTIEPATGLITWEFSEKDAGEYKVQITASDPEGAKIVQELTLSIP